MRIAIGSDHAGFEQKQSLVSFLSNKGFDIVDYGPENDDSVDYPLFAKKVGQAVSNGEADRGILICGTGIGMALTADKFKGVRASSITTQEFAELARRHNDLNVICLSGRFISDEVNKKIVETFLNTTFEGGRHKRRVDLIEA